MSPEPQAVLLRGRCLMASRNGPASWIIHLATVMEAVLSGLWWWLYSSSEFCP